MFTKKKIFFRSQNIINQSVGTKKICNNFKKVLTFFFLGINETLGKYHRDSELRDLYYVHSKPEFDNSQPTNVSSIVGKTAFLTCVVRNLKPSQKVNFLNI